MCDAALTVYADELESRLDLIPSLVLWSANNCGGIQTPSSDVDFTALQPGQPTFNVSTSVEALYIPPTVDVTLFSGSDGGGSSMSVRTAFGGPAADEIVISNLRQLGTYASSTTLVTGNVQSVMVTFNTVSPYTSANTFRMSVCQDEDFFIGPVRYRALAAHTAGCDAFAENYCQGDNLENSFCNCIRDQALLQLAYPNNSVPVTCLGANCATAGYRTQAMVATTCNVVICDQLIQEIGNELGANSNSTIFCGNHYYHVTPTPTMAPNPTSSARRQKFPAYGYIVIFTIIAVLVVVLPIVIIRFRKQ